MRRAVAGSDFTFSVPKSAFTLWAVADADTQALIGQAHHAKALVLFGALVEYLRPWTGRVASREQRAHESSVRGSNGTDTEVSGPGGVEG